MAFEGWSAIFEGRVEGSGHRSREGEDGMEIGDEQVSAQQEVEGAGESGSVAGVDEKLDGAGGAANPMNGREGATRGAARNGEGGGLGVVVPTAANGAMIDLDFVRGLIEAVDGSGIDTLEITRGGTRIRISKTPPSAAQVVGAPAVAQVPAGMPGAPVYLPAPPQQQPAPPPAPAAGTASAPSEAAAEAEAAAPARNLVEVKSPMVGTFYRAPAPEAPPYVEVGSHVTKGQTLCILEAMKLMNELESEVDGIVREILVNNADPVEYGQVLFRIEPTGK